MTTPAAAVTALARSMPEQSAVTWVHTAATVAHARAWDLIPDAGGVLHGVEHLAQHPALTGYADLLDRRPDAAGVALLDQVAATNHTPDPPHRPDGHQLGDLYQQLSTEARKGRALCQTPAWVTELLMDLALEPARREYGHDLNIMDPACGTGHILMEATIRQLSRFGDRADTRWREDRVARALSTVHGVDLDSYAALTARYRLLALLCRYNAGRGRLVDAPAEWVPRVECANSLLDDGGLLTRGRYQVVIANPPYITVKDARLNEAIRARYPQVCSGKYSLALPFFQLMTELLAPGGWCAQLTANSFMKREFGRKFVEDYLPRYDLRWVIDTSGAYIPGHGTPTVILVHRNQPPSSDRVNAVMGVRGEPSRPEDPARGLVWSAIRDGVRGVLAAERFADGARAAYERDHPTPAAVVPEQRRPVGYTQPSLLDLLAA